ncbi:redox-regulated ATPase YchF [Candidatus Microgenomates bacterium]|nr:redox-regulated ATPase YchF [Candidatus Microgenomates bacterium]
MNLSVGIVGLPNVGKSTLFNALLKRQIADVANYPFCTIEPNVGVVEVPDDRLPVLAKVVNTKKIVPAIVKFVDIAGLVKGASKGEGLGNKFLSHIREVSVIAHVIRSFKDENVIHVAGQVDPKSDWEVINSELILADLETVSRAKEGKFNRTLEKDQIKMALLNRLEKELDLGKLAKDVEMTDEELEIAREMQLMTLKPVIYVVNVDEEKLNKDPKTLINFAPGESAVVAISAKTEQELSELSPQEQKEYLKQLGLEKSGLERLIQVAYGTLGLISFLTAGEKEVRAWTIKKGTKAPQAAGTIHTDFESHFIKAEIASYQDFVEFGGWASLREKGKVRFEGKEYEMREGDVVEFRVNA